MVTYFVNNYFKSILSTWCYLGNVLVGKSKVVESDTTASNGVIHTIDSVLLPSSIRKKLNKSMKKSSHKHLKGADRD